MRRIALVALLLVMASFVTLSAQAPAFAGGLGSLNIGTIYAMKAVEIDGQPGSEYLVQTGGPFAPAWRAVYPAQGACVSPGSVVLQSEDEFVDHDGDGKKEIKRFNFQAQTVAFIPFPVCSGK